MKKKTLVILLMIVLIIIGGIALRLFRGDEAGTAGPGHGTNISETKETDIAAEKNVTVEVPAISKETIETETETTSETKSQSADNGPEQSDQGTENANGDAEDIDAEYGTSDEDDYVVELEQDEVVDFN